MDKIQSNCGFREGYKASYTIHLSPSAFRNMVEVMNKILPVIDKGGRFVIESNEDDLQFIFTESDSPIVRHRHLL
jgi:hypothetical protein